MSFVKQPNLLHIIIFAFILTLLLSGCTQNNVNTSSNADTSSKNEIAESQTDESQIVYDLPDKLIDFPDGFGDGEEYFIDAPTGGCDKGTSFYVAIQSKLTASLSSETFPVCVSYGYLGNQKDIDELYPNYKAVLELCVNDQRISLKEIDLSRFIEDGHKLDYRPEFDENDHLTEYYTFPTGEIFTISTDLMQPNERKYDNFSIVITLYDGEAQLYTDGIAGVYYHREEDEIKFFLGWSDLEDYLISIGEIEAEIETD